MKERLTITLESDLLKKLDTTIDGVNIRNRSHAIERLLNLALSQAMPKKAVIFAGGNVINMKGHEEMPKPMIQIKGKPMLEYVIKELRRNEIHDMVIVIGKGGDKVTDYFGDGTIFGVRINYIKEDTPRGTANALDLARGLLGNAPFFAVNGDNLFHMNLLEMYKQHITTNALATIALLTSDVTTNFGVTKLDGFKITSFVEKPENEKGRLVSAGVYVFNPSIFEVLHKGSTAPTTLERTLFPKLASSGSLYGYVFSTPWYTLDANNLDSSVKKLEKVVDTFGEE